MIILVDCIHVCEEKLLCSLLFEMLSLSSNRPEQYLKQKRYYRFVRSSQFELIL